MCELSTSLSISFVCPEFDSAFGGSFGAGLPDGHAVRADTDSEEDSALLAQRAEAFAKQVIAWPRQQSATPKEHALDSVIRGCCLYRTSNPVFLVCCRTVNRKLLCH